MSLMQFEAERTQNTSPQPHATTYLGEYEEFQGSPKAEWSRERRDDMKVSRKLWFLKYGGKSSTCFYVIIIWDCSFTRLFSSQSAHLVRQSNGFLFHDTEDLEPYAYVLVEIDKILKGSYRFTPMSQIGTDSSVLQGFIVVFKANVSSAQIDQYAYEVEQADRGTCAGKVLTTDQDPEQPDGIVTIQPQPSASSTSGSGSVTNTQTTSTQPGSITSSATGIDSGNGTSTSTTSAAPASNGATRNGFFWFF
ncbi:hypothetical protein DFP72DRAFT_1097732 [Ephemerocybe angulata]|uniref:Uncharacterized protein n=1 Tax=Ephemerocybe angulata TaxID=980116 RepID=A0A8H6HDN6_9AGAR|nr:hypothetical protein DFP72DRAFT_1097732 [Tulosesus angulatus]